METKLFLTFKTNENKIQLPYEVRAKMLINKVGEKYSKKITEMSEKLFNPFFKEERVKELERVKEAEQL